jgi:hypothetical protein
MCAALKCLGNKRSVLQDFQTVLGPFSPVVITNIWPGGQLALQDPR